MNDPKKAATVMLVLDEIIGGEDFSDSILPALRRDALRNLGKLGTVVESSLTSEVRRPNPSNPGDYLEDDTLTPYAKVCFSAMVIPGSDGCTPAS